MTNALVYGRVCVFPAEIETHDVVILHALLGINIHGCQLQTTGEVTTDSKDPRFMAKYQQEAEGNWRGQYVSSCRC